MANNFKGYLIRRTVDNKNFPDKYIQYSTYSSDPDQREELKAYRDDNTRNLTRVTADGMKSKITFQTRENLHLDEKIEIQKFFTDKEISKKQKTISLKFWNDETNDYDTGTFYRPNMNFPIKKITDDDIIYGAMTITCIEC